MRLDNHAYVPTQVASSFINIESYTRDTHLIISKAEGEPTYIGRTYEMSPLTGGGSEFSGLVQNILKLAPDNSLVVVNEICYPDYDAPYIMAKGKRYGSELIQELIQRQAQLYQKALVVDALTSIPMINRKTVVVSLMTPSAEVNQAAMEAALDTQTEFLNGLVSCGFFDAHVLSPGEILGVYRQFTNIYEPRKSVPVDELLDLRQQAYGPDNLLDFRDKDYGILNKDIFCAVVVPKALPKNVANGLMNLVVGAPLNAGATREGGGQRVKVPYIINATVRVADQRKEAERVARAIKSRERYESLPFSLGTEDTEDVLQDLRYMAETCSDGTNKYTYVSLSMFLFSKSKPEVIAARSSIKTTLDNLLFDSRSVTDTVGVRFAQALPQNFSLKIADKLENEALMPASSAACLLPIFGDYQGNSDLDSDRTGSVFLTRRGSAYYYDLFRTNGNKNGILSAKSGVGKSFSTQYMITNALAEGTKVYLFDNGKSAKKFCEGAKGEFVEFDLDSGKKPSINPYTGLTEKEFDEQSETISALVLKMAYFNEPVEAGARIAVSESVKAAYGQKQGKADINTVIDSLQQIKEATSADAARSEVAIAAANLIPRLKNFVESPSRGPFFTGQSTLDPKNLFTVFELSALDGDEHLKQCVLFFVMNQLMRTVKKSTGRKLIILDEAWQLLKDEGAAAVMEGLYRKARKDGGSIWVITQSPRDLAGNPTGDVILSQSTWKLVMEQETEEIDKIIAEGVMTKFAGDAFFNKLIKDVKTLKGVYSEILICGESSYEVVRLYVDRFTEALYSTDGEDRDSVFKLMREGVPAIDAVNMVIGESKSKRSKWLKDIVSQLRKFDNLTDAEIRGEIDEVLNG